MFKVKNVNKVIMILLGVMISIVVASTVIDIIVYDAEGNYSSIVSGSVGILMSVFIASLILLVHKDNVEWRRCQELELKCSVLDGIYIELDDVYSHIKSRRDLYIYEKPGEPPVEFTHAYFYHDTYDKVLNSLQIHNYGLEINKIKKIIHNIKEHNRIWLKFDSIVPDFYDKEPEIKDDAQIQLYYRRLEGYEKILIKEIPIVLQYIKSARGRLSNHQS